MDDYTKLSEASKEALRSSPSQLHGNIIKRLLTLEAECAALALKALSTPPTYCQKTGRKYCE